MIQPPFANYHRAALERLVQEGFDRIEAHAFHTRKRMFPPYPPALDAHDFQVLMAAYVYLQQTDSKET